MTRARLTLLVLLALGAVAWFVFAGDGPPDPTLDPGAGGRSDDAHLRGAEAPDSDTGPALATAPPKVEEDSSGVPVRGRVVDAETGAGIAGVRLFAALRGSRSKDHPDPLVAWTADDGTFVLGHAVPGTWIVLPFHKDFHVPFYAGLWRAEASKANPWKSSKAVWQAAERDGLLVDVAEGAGEPDAIELRMHRGEPLVGRVLGPDDAPVPGASIRARIPYYCAWGPARVGLHNQARELDLVVSDADGRFTLGCFPPELASVRLGVRHTRLVGRWMDKAVPLPAAFEVELRLVEPAVIEGRVQWSDGSPESAADLRIEAARAWILADEGRWSHQTWAKANADGRFRVGGLPPGDLAVRAFTDDDAPRRGRGKLPVSALESGETRKGLVITLDDQRRISGRLVDADGSPLAAEVLDARRGDAFIDRDWTDENGAFSISVGEGGAVALVLVTGGREEVLVAEIEPPRDGLRLVSTATPSHTLDLKLLDPRGHVIPSYELELWSPRGGTDDHEVEEIEDGVARLTLRGALPTRLEVEKFENKDGEKLPWARHGVWLPDPLPPSITVQLPSVPEFYGEIVDQHGAPVPGVRLTVRDKLPKARRKPGSLYSEPRPVRVGPDGRFRFAALDPESDRADSEVVVPPGYRLDHGAYLSAGEFERIVVHGGGKPVRGRVEFDGDGTVDLSDIEVHAAWLTDPGDLVGGDIGTGTDAEGRFAFEALPEGARIEVRIFGADLAERGLFAERELLVVEAGTMDVRFTVRRGGVIAGKLVGPGLADVDLERSLVCILDDQGDADFFHHDSIKPTRAAPVFRLGGVPPGTHRVGLLSVDEQGVRLLASMPGVRTGSESVTLHVPRHRAVLEGVVALPASAKIEEAKVTVHHLDGLRRFLTVPVDMQGRFRVERLDPALEYSVRVVVVTAEQGTLVAEAHGVRTGQPLMLEPSSGLDIAYRIEGLRPREQFITVVARRGRIERDEMLYDGGDVAYLSRLAPGAYELWVEDQYGERISKPVKVRAGSKDVVVLKAR